MSLDKNHSEQFEKYLKGKMSPEDAHAFEREVLNDPFAQEALEGFEATGQDAFDDVAMLKARIASTKRDRFSWMQIVAVGALLIVGSFSVFYFTSGIKRQQLALDDEPLEKMVQSNPSPDTISTSTLKGEPADQQDAVEIKTDSEEKFYAASESKPEETQSSENIVSRESDHDSDLFLAESQETEEEMTASLEDDQSHFEDDLEARKVGIQVAQVEEPTSEISVDSTLLEEVVVSAQPLVAKKESLGNVERTISDEEVASKSIRPSGAMPRSLLSGTPVTGIVTDDNGEPLPGVNVVIKGTTTGVITDDEGRYVLSDASNETLVFAFVGFESQEIEVDDRSDINVMLGSELELQEVVVVGYDEDSQDNDLSYSPARPEIGNRAFKQYIDENLIYPTAAITNKIEGIVVLELTIDDNGQVSNIDVKRSLGYGCDTEAIRLVKEGPEWIAAAKDGIAVEDKLRVRVKFKLDR